MCACIFDIYIYSIYIYWCFVFLMLWVRCESVVPARKTKLRQAWLSWRTGDGHNHRQGATVARTESYHP